MPSLTEQLRSIGLGPDEWRKVGRFEVNARTGERRPIPGLELGPTLDDVESPLTKENPLGIPSAADQWATLGRGIADLPGYVADGASYLAQNYPPNLMGQMAAAAITGTDFGKLRQNERDLKDKALEPYRRAARGIGPETPAFSDNPIAATILGGLRSAPQTALTAVTGGVGAAMSGAQQADQAYQEMKSRGIPDYIAIPASGLVGSAQGALDKVGAEGAFKGATGSLLGRTLKGAGMEGVTEAAQEGIGIAGESLTGKDQVLGDVRDRVSSAFAGGMLSGGALGAAPRIDGVNANPEVPTPIAQAKSLEIEERVFPQRRVLDYAKMAMDNPRRALGTALVDAGTAVAPELKREMILDTQTELSLKTEWDKARQRINADPEAAVIRLDLDGVKSANDNLGHDVADQVVFRPMADAVHAIADKYGIGERLRFRAGGDELVLVVPKDVAPQISEELKEATKPRFAPVPPDKAALAGMPEGAYVQYGASVGWGMDDHAADQEVYKIKESRPKRGTLVGPEAVPQLVSQTEAEDQVIEAQAQIAQSRSTRFPPRFGVRDAQFRGPEAVQASPAIPGQYPLISPPGTDTYLAQIADKTAPFSRSRDKRFSEAPTGPGWDPGTDWGSLLGNDRDPYGPVGTPMFPEIGAARETIFSPGWEQAARSAHRMATAIAEQAAPGTPIDGLYGIKRNIQVLDPGDPRSVAQRRPRSKAVPEYPGAPVSPWADPPGVELRSGEELASPPYPPSRTEAVRQYGKEGEERASWRAEWFRGPSESMADYASRIPDGIADAERRGWPDEARRLQYVLATVSESEEVKGLSTREAMAGAGLLMGVPVGAVNSAIDGAASVLGRANEILQKYGTARGNLPEGWMQSIEGAAQNERAAKLETDYLAQDYGAALAKEIGDGTLPAELNFAAQAYLEGEMGEHWIPEGMKPALDQIRGYIDENISQELIDSGVARDPAHAQAIIRNKGKYLHRTFKMHTETGWAEKMRGTPTFEKAVDDVIAREDEFFQDIVNTRNSLAAEYEGRANVLAWQADKAIDLLAQRDSVLRGMKGGQDAFQQQQAAGFDQIRGEATANGMADLESGLAQVGSQADASLSAEEQAYADDMAILGEYETTFGVDSPGLGWAKDRLRAEHEEAKKAVLRGERRDARDLIRGKSLEERRADQERRESLRQSKAGAQFAAMAAEGDVRDRFAQEMGSVFSESNSPNTAGPLDYGRRDLRSRLAAEREALRQRYARKLGIAKSRASWAERKQAENAANQSRRKDVAGKVEEMITYDPRPVSPGGLQGLSRAWLKMKKDIRQPMLDVMGAYEDPIAGFVIASERAARSIGMKKMWDDIILGSEGREVFVGKPQPGFATKIPGVTISRDGQELDVYTSSELKEALEYAFDTGHQSTGVGRAIDLVNGVLKANATVFSLAGANRNTLSSMIPLLANGNLIPGLIRHGRSAFKVAAANASWGYKEWRQEAIDMTKHGVIGSNVDMRDLERYFKRVVEDPVTRTPIQSALKAAKDFYAMGDTVAKVITFKCERDRYAKAMGLPRDSPEVTARAAEVTKRIIQNYDRLPRWAKATRNSLAVGPFVSFPAAVISNVGGSVQTIAEDLASDNPKVKAEGLVRAAWFSATLGGLAFGEQLLKSAFKGNEDEERDQEVIDGIRPLLPPWQKNAQMALWEKYPGFVKYVDMSFMNYYGTVTDPFAQLLRGDLTKDGVPKAMWDMSWTAAKKIFGEELALSAYADFTRGPARGGPEVVNDEMTRDVILYRVADWSMRNVAPGTLRNFYRAAQAEPGHRMSELWSLSGFKITNVPLAQGYDMALYENVNDRDAIKSSLRSSINSTSFMSIPTLGANLKGYGPSMNSIFTKAAENYQRVVKLGVDPQVAGSSLGEKLDKPGKIILGGLQSGDTVEASVQRALMYDWNKQRANLQGKILEKQREGLENYKEKYRNATQEEIERRRRDLEQWAAEARQAVDAASPVPEPPPGAGSTFGDPFEKLRTLGGVN